MTEFLDGPAQGTKLMLGRAPHFLRAVQAKDGTWDALDQLADTPAADERIVVYVMVGEPTWMHVRASRGRSGVYRGGKYTLVDPQPPEPVLRERSQWEAWAQARFESR